MNRLARYGTRRGPRLGGHSDGVTLVELLVVVAIGTVVSGAILLVWFAVGRSYALTTSGSDARDFARDATARLARELRDAEPDGVLPALISAGNDEVVFTTTFNDANNALVGSEPVLTRYYYEQDGAEGVLHRQRDTDGDGKLVEDDGVTRDPGDRDMVLVRNLLNHVDGEGTADVFRYTYINQEGGLTESAPSVPSNSLPTIFLVRVSLSVDMNPQAAPEPMRISTTVQLRNQSRF